MRNHCAIALLTLLVGCDTEPDAKHAPFLSDSTPGVGAIITDTAQGELEVTAALGDENVEDSLFVRFLIDYPSIPDLPARLLFAVNVPPSGEVVRGTVRLHPSCAQANLRPGLHRLTMSVADRRFLDPLEGDDVAPDAPLDSVADDAHRLRTIWLLNCP